MEGLASGSFGKTYLAADMRRPGYPQCIVRQFQFPSRNPKALQVVQLLFKKKAETLEKLGNHECIPQLLACFEQDTQLYFVEEYVLGHPLSQELSPGQQLSEDFVIRLLYDVLTVLSYVHNNGVIHRNIRPENLVRRDSDGWLVLINFGLIQEISNPSPRAQPEVPKDIGIGTLAYLSPEQRQGNPLYNSDLYAAGMICVQALTGWSAKELLLMGRRGGLSGGDEPSEGRSGGRADGRPGGRAAGRGNGTSRSPASPGQGDDSNSPEGAGADGAKGESRAASPGDDLGNGTAPSEMEAGTAKAAGEVLNWRTAAAVDPILADFIDRLIRPHFDLRYQSADEALNDLKTLYGLMSEAGLS